MVANLARGQLNSENVFFPLLQCSGFYSKDVILATTENLVSRDRFYRPFPRKPAYSLDSG